MTEHMAAMNFQVMMMAADMQLLVPGAMLAASHAMALCGARSHHTDPLDTADLAAGLR